VTVAAGGGRGLGLGALLIEEGLLEAEALAAAERHGREHGCALVVAVLDRRQVSDEALVALLERRLGLRRVDLGAESVDAEALREVPYDTAERRLVLPLAVDTQGDRRVLRLAMADPLDAAVLDEIESSTGCGCEVALAGASDLGRAVERCYRGIVTKLIHRSEPGWRESGAGVRDAGVAGSEPEVRLGSRGVADATPRPLGGAPITQPLHHIEEEATIDQRLRALLGALYTRAALSPEEYVEALRTLLKREQG
jgi:hypothetical protein